MNELFALASGYGQGRLERQQMRQEQSNWDRQMALREEIERRQVGVSERGVAVQEDAQTFEEWAFGQIPAQAREAFRLQELGLDRDYEVALRGQDFDKMAREGSLQEMIRQFDETMQKISLPELRMKQSAEERVKSLFSFERAIKMAETIGAWTRARYETATLDDRIFLSGIAGQVAKMQMDAERLKLGMLPEQLAAELYNLKAQGYYTRRQGDEATERILTERALRPYRESGMISQEDLERAQAYAVRSNVGISAYGAETDRYGAETDRMRVMMGPQERPSRFGTNTASARVTAYEEALKDMRGKKGDDLAKARERTTKAEAELAEVLDELGLGILDSIDTINGLPLSEFRQQLVKPQSSQPRSGASDSVVGMLQPSHRPQVKNRGLEGIDVPWDDSGTPSKSSPRYPVGTALFHLDVPWDDSGTPSKSSPRYPVGTALFHRSGAKWFVIGSDPSRGVQMKDSTMPGVTQWVPFSEIDKEWSTAKRPASQPLQPGVSSF